ncbi:hypothetical protein N0V83_005418 [Neocucurbitaria cava]|uniref:Uncharacterized protein n=1 Tax=Neocucurbitaria cava TaxID=798079 RepID=A0A9W9CM28_9PLEO|nr:hypothetical protein N0V83_005418 [Neocucurbitaria cava]
MKPVLAQTLHFETMQALLMPVPTERSSTTSRKGIKTLCYDSGVRKVFYVTCPLRLMEAIHDITLCAQNIFRAHGMLSAADVYKREWILSDVLGFRPEEATQNVKENYYSTRELSPLELLTWNTIFSAWRSAITIVVVRYLYLGLPNPEVPLQLSRSPTPSIGELRSAQAATFDESLLHVDVLDNLDVGPSFEGNIGAKYELDRLSPGYHLVDPISRTPSPLLSVRSSTDDISLDYWSRRYEIHNEAFQDLSSNFLSLAEYPDPKYLRYALMPFMVLALVSSPDSPERALCLATFDRFKELMSEAAVLESENAATSPVGGQSLGFDIPWGKLDAYSKRNDIERQEGVVFVENQLRGSAPEWNWWYMLQEIELKTTWPITAGTMHMETGTEYWPFSVLSSVLTQDCFSAFMRPTATTQGPSFT